MIETVWPPFMVFKGLKMEIEKLYSYLARPKNKKTFLKKSWESVKGFGRHREMDGQTHRRTTWGWELASLGQTSTETTYINYKSETPVIHKLDNFPQLQ